MNIFVLKKLYLVGLKDVPNKKYNTMKSRYLLITHTVRFTILHSGIIVHNA